MDAVPGLLREAAEEAVLPVFRSREARPEEKSPGEWVTTADRAAEAFLTPRLAALVPGSVVVGEEATASNPILLEHLATSTDVWLLDPLDGTANFAAGEVPFSLMVALVHDRETVGSWMLDPLSGQLAAAERGGGAILDAEQVRTDKAGLDPQAMRGAVLCRFLPADLLSHVGTVERQFAALAPGSGCAGHDYPAVVTGELGFALYWRTLPWDHAPGTLFAVEAGGVAARPDGSSYRACDYQRPGLLVAPNPDVWLQVRDLLVPERHW